MMLRILIPSQVPKLVSRQPSRSSPSRRSLSYDLGSGICAVCEPPAASQLL